MADRPESNTGEFRNFFSILPEVEDLDCVLQGGHRLVEPVEVAQRHPKVVVSLGDTPGIRSVQNLYKNTLHKLV